MMSDESARDRTLDLPMPSLSIFFNFRVYLKYFKFSFSLFLIFKETMKSVIFL